MCTCAGYDSVHRTTKSYQSVMIVFDFALTHYLSICGFIVHLCTFNSKLIVIMVPMGLIMMHHGCHGSTCSKYARHVHCCGILYLAWRNCEGSHLASCQDWSLLILGIGFCTHEKFKTQTFITTYTRTHLKKKPQIVQSPLWCFLCFAWHLNSSVISFIYTEHLMLLW